jgi:hypothetical protein
MAWETSASETATSPVGDRARDEPRVDGVLGSRRVRSRLLRMGTPRVVVLSAFRGLLLLRGRAGLGLEPFFEPPQILPEGFLYHRCS